MKSSELFQPRDGVYGVQYRHGMGSQWGFVLAVGTEKEARELRATAKGADTRLVIAKGGEWKPAHTPSGSQGIGTKKLDPLTLRRLRVKVGVATDTA